MLYRTNNNYGIHNTDDGYIHWPLCLLMKCCQ